jgi:SAM-dependent methyltransferase
VDLSPGRRTGRRDLAGGRCDAKGRGATPKPCDDNAWRRTLRSRGFARARSFRQGPGVFSAVTGYDRFMGRFAASLAPAFAGFAEIRPGQRVLDVGCGPGALLGELARLAGEASAVGVDPSQTFAAAARARHPGVAVEIGTAEALPFPDDSFDAALAQLVVHFMSDPVAGLADMARVTRPGGPVAACVWDHAGGTGPLELFWSAARELDADVDDESGRTGTRQGQLGELFVTAGLVDVEELALTVAVEYSGFDEWWEMFTLGVAPAGVHVAGLAADEREALRIRCAEKFAKLGSTVITGSAWAARAHVASSLH